VPDLFHGTSGPHDADIAVVGESYGREEAGKQKPFVGQSGKLLDQLLAAAGIDRTEVFCSNVISEQPPGNDMWQFFYPTVVAKKEGKEEVRRLFPRDNVKAGVNKLRQQLLEVKPKVVIGLGNYTLWALTDDFFGVDNDNYRRIPTGIIARRGSQLYCRDDMGGFPLMPTIHPAAAMRQWQYTYDIRHDLKQRLPKALNDDWGEPDYQFVVRPTFEAVVDCLAATYAELESGPRRLAVDLETFQGHIDCIGIATSDRSAICIPFMGAEDPREHYWSLEAEIAIIQYCRRLLTHPNIQVVGQNYLYDAQYFARYWCFIPTCWMDTMLAYHACWPGVPKDLGRLSSICCEYHRYWKDEGKGIRELKVDAEQRWRYNCKDAVSTHEISYVLEGAIKSQGQEETYKFLMDQFPMVLDMMLHGVRQDLQVRAEVTMELSAVIGEYDRRFDIVVPQDVFPPQEKKSSWWRSPMQQCELFYDIFCVSEYKHRKTRARTMNDEALERIKRIEPVLTPIVEMLQEYRSLGIFLNNFCLAKLDPDDRMRCSYNIGGTETYRWSSSENAFGRGTNLQNLPKGTEDE
jgi:uracil-DNA glycosylase family 4